MALNILRYALYSLLCAFAQLVEQLKPPCLDVQEQSESQEGGYDGSASVADEGERYTYDGHDAYGHAHVDEYIERDHGYDASGHENAEPVLCVLGGIDADQQQ